MKTEYKPYVDALIELAIREDIGDGDHTSLCCIPADERGRMRLLCKQEGTIAGIEIARLVLERLDPTVEFDQRIADGTRVRPGDVAFYVAGSLRSLLQAERILLNIMQRMSGVATQTAVYVARLEGLHTKVLDTRKTTPGMRVLDKMAVKLGGGENHRMGLFDMILLKDNHIDFAGGIVPAIRGAKQYLRERDKNIPIECEVRTLEDIDLVFEAGGVDRIMFDNFSPEMTRKRSKRSPDAAKPSRAAASRSIRCAPTPRRAWTSSLWARSRTRSVRSTCRSKPASSRPQAVTARRCRSRQACEHPDRERS